MFSTKIVITNFREELRKFSFMFLPKFKLQYLKTNPDSVVVKSEVKSEEKCRKFENLI